MIKNFDPVPALDESLIYSHLSMSGKTQIDAIDVFQSIESTNTYLLQQPFTQGRARVCVTEEQTAGRGRRGNSWLSAPHKNVTLSVSWSFSHWPETLSGLSLAVALVAAERLNEDFRIGVKIKWPNDLLVGDHKLAGVLIDVAGEANSVCNVVIGVGLNVHQPDWATADADYAWLDLHSLGVTIDRNQFIANFVDDCLTLLKGFEENGFAPLAQQWNDYSSFTNRVIRVGDKEHSITGIMQGVDSNGALLLEDEQGHEHVFSDSTVSVRLV